MNPAIIERVPAMSSKDIARLTGKKHRNVLRDIKATLEAANIDVLRFEQMYEDGYGRRQPCYYLPKFELDLVISGYSIPYRAAIIRRWHELESRASQSTPSNAAWLVARLLEIMPAEQLLRLLKVRHPYGSIARNGKPRTGWRGPAYVAAKHREDDARVFQDGVTRLSVTVQLELPKFAEVTLAGKGGAL